MNSRPEFRRKMIVGTLATTVKQIGKGTAPTLKVRLCIVPWLSHLVVTASRLTSSTGRARVSSEKGTPGIIASGWARK